MEKQTLAKWICNIFRRTIIALDICCVQHAGESLSFRKASLPSRCVVRCVASHPIGSRTLTLGRLIVPKSPALPVWWSCGCSNAVLCQLLNFACPILPMNPVHCKLRQDLVRSTKSRRDHRFKFSLVSLWRSTSIHIFAWGIVCSQHCSRKRFTARKTYRYCTRWQLFAYFVGVTSLGALKSIDEHVGIRSWKRQKICLSRWETG